MARFILAIAIGVIVSVASSAALAGDAGYRFHPTTFVCTSPDGVIGYNPAHLGECGDHRGLYYRGYNFENAKMAGSNFSGKTTDLREASFYLTDLRSSNFSKANLQSANFGYSRLIGADFRNSKARKAIFFWTNLQNARLQGADFSFADLRGATMHLSFIDSSTKFEYAIYDGYTTLPFSDEKAQLLKMKKTPSVLED